MGVVSTQLRKRQHLVPLRWEGLEHIVQEGSFKLPKLDMLPFNGCLLYRAVGATRPHLDVQQSAQLLYESVPDLRSTIHANELRHDPRAADAAAKSTAYLTMIQAGYRLVEDATGEHTDVLEHRGDPAQRTRRRWALEVNDHVHPREEGLGGDEVRGPFCLCPTVLQTLPAAVDP
jgi:hypothetical protein